MENVKGSMELWKPIIGWESRYEVSDQGRVRNIITQHILKPMKTGAKRKSGYRMKVRFSTNPRVDLSVAHLVLTTFYGPRKADQVSMHKNDLPEDNRLDNLCWGTMKENMVDSASKFRRGGQKLSNEQKREIYYRRSQGEKGKYLAKEYNISAQLVCDIFKGRTHNEQGVSK